MTTSNGYNPVTSLPVFPAVAFDETAYARLQLRLDLYHDMIVATRYNDGKSDQSYVVDPLAVAQALAGLSINSGLLPENVLFWQRREGEERVGLWIPPQVWRLRVEPTDRENRVIPLPGMVLVGQGKTYSLYALDIPHRPGPDAPLYRAPCPNVNGSVCHGNVPFPVAGATTIAEAARLFFESGFNNHLSNGKSQKYPDEVLRMWRVLHRAQVGEYPLADLVPAERGFTLERLMNQ